MALRIGRRCADARLHQADLRIHRRSFSVESGTEG
jgi:hypothetical protein